MICPGMCCAYTTIPLTPTLNYDHSALYTLNLIPKSYNFQTHIPKRRNVTSSVKEKNTANRFNLQLDRLYFLVYAELYYYQGNAHNMNVYT